MHRYFKATLLILLTAGMLSGCQRGGSLPDLPKEGTISAAQTLPVSGSQNGQLMAFAETHEAAQQLAELYGIELVDYRHEIALFRTDEDPDEVIRRGRENGWPELSRNNSVKAF